MKKNTLAVIALLALASCSKVSEKVQQVKEAKEAVTQVSDVMEEAKNLESDIKKLREATPITNDELKACLPEEIMGMKRISYKAGETSMLNVSSISAEYANEDKSKKFSMTLTDGAGPMASSIVSGVKMGMARDFEEESEEGFRRSITRNGVKAIEEQKKDKSYVKIIINDRFFLDAKGSHMSVEELWKAVETLNFDNLPSI